MAKHPEGRVRHVRVGDEVVTVPAPTKGEHGTMVEQSAEARSASRGGASGTMLGNMMIREKLIAAGVSPGGDTDDGTTRTGIPQEDDMRAAEPSQPNTLPQDPGLVKVSPTVEGVTAGKPPADAMTIGEAQRKRDADAAEEEAKAADEKAKLAKDRADAVKRK